MTQIAVKIKNKGITSFELGKLVTTSRFFSKIKLTPSAKLVLRCLIDFWNSDKKYCFPKQSTIADATGLSRHSVVTSIEELRNKSLILTVKADNRLNYYFTNLFFEHLGLHSENISLEVSKNDTGIGENPSQPYIKDNNKKLINRFSNNNFPDRASSTRKLLDQIVQDKLNKKSPYDDKQTAISWLNSLDDKALKLIPIREMAKKVAQKWQLEKEIQKL